MSKSEWFGLAVLGAGAIFGFITGGPFGLVLAAVCLVVGLVLLVASEALGTKRRPVDPAAVSSSQPKTHILTLVKEVHARPQRGGKFQEIREPTQTDLQFEIFAHCWLVNTTDQRLGIDEVRLSLSRSEGSRSEGGTLTLEPVPGDLQGWRLGRLKDELDSWGVRYLQAAQEQMSELNTVEPLEGGATREGWLHCRIQSITPVEISKGSIQLAVRDSQGGTHIGTAPGPPQVPGRVWPFRPERERVRVEIEGALRNDAAIPGTE